MGESSTRSVVSVLSLMSSTGDPDGVPVLGANHWSATKMACLLHSTTHLDPALSFTGNMLACYTDHFDRS